MPFTETGWSTLTSLHHTLQPDDVPILEEAVCAQLRGEYVKAKTIIEDRLSSSLSLPVVAIAMADVYDGMGLERQRLEVLKRALSDKKFCSRRTQGNEWLLLRIIRALAEILCDGGLHYWYRQILADRKKIALFEYNEANDIDVNSVPS